MAREDPQLKLRLPAKLHERVVAAARANGRSLNSELVQRVEESFLEEKARKNDEYRAALTKLFDTMLRLHDVPDEVIAESVVNKLNASLPDEKPKFSKQAVAKDIGETRRAAEQLRVAEQTATDDSKTSKRSETQ